MSKTDRAYQITDGVTQSLLLDWCCCRLRALRRIQGWRPIRTKDSLNKGDLFHWMLERHYKDETFSLYDWVAEREVELTQDLEMMLSNVHALFTNYVDFWGEKDKAKEWVSLESEFDVKWKGFRLIGKRDGLFRPKKGSGLWLFETKTTSGFASDSQVMSDRLSFDFQNLFYITATETEMRVPIEGVLYNTARIPIYRKGSKENPSQFFARVRAAIESQQRTFYQRHEIYYPECVKREFRNDLHTKLVEFSKWLRGESPTFRNESQCYTKWACDYLHCCASGTFDGYKRIADRFPELFSVGKEGGADA